MSRKNRTRQRTPAIRYVVVMLAIVVLVLGLVSTRRANAHPSPRTDMTDWAVDDAERYAEYPRVADTYRMAAAIPNVLDGLYCHCDCSKHSDHRSLLTCFQSDHGAACDVCLTEAALAYRMTQEGRSLGDIRKAIDGLYP